MASVFAVDQEMLDVPKHPDAKLYPSEIVTLALLLAIKGGGRRVAREAGHHAGAEQPWR